MAEVLVDALVEGLVLNVSFSMLLQQKGGHKVLHCFAFEFLDDFRFKRVKHLLIRLWDNRFNSVLLVKYIPFDFV